MFEALLSMEGLRGGYGDYLVIDEVSLKVGKGQVVGLLGPNGHGKTTLANMISGLVPVLSGDINFRGQGIDNRSPEQVVLMGISHIPQGDRVFPQMSVEENLLAGAYLRWPERQERIDEIFVKFPKLKQRREVAARVLSGGERRMLALARGLMNTPDVLIVDEPSLGLAPRMRDSLYGILKEISSSGTSMLLIEEKTSQLEGFVDYVYVLESGQIVLEGDTDDILGDSEGLVKVLAGI
mgnify:CR=1 FL=1